MICMNVIQKMKRIFAHRYNKNESCWLFQAVVSPDVTYHARVPQSFVLELCRRREPIHYGEHTHFQRISSIGSRDQRHRDLRRLLRVQSHINLDRRVQIHFRSQIGPCLFRLGNANHSSRRDHHPLAGQQVHD